MHLTIEDHPRYADILRVAVMANNERLLLKSDDISGKHQYDLSYYKRPALSDREFVALLDRNVVHYLVKLARGINVKGRASEDVFRSAAALQAFMVAAGIVLEPGVAFHELLDARSVDSANAELDALRAIDNADPERVLDVAVGCADQIPLKNNRLQVGVSVTAQMAEHRVRGFEYNLTIAKKAIVVRAAGKSGADVFCSLLDWMHSEYISTAPALFYYAIACSHHPERRMLKGVKLKDARNIAWDLCLLQTWRSRVRREGAERVFLSTFDEGVKKVATLMSQQNGESAAGYTRRVQGELSQLYGQNTGDGNRVFNRIMDLMNSIDAPERDHNTGTNYQNHDFILKAREAVDNEFAELAAA